MSVRQSGGPNHPTILTRLINALKGLNEPWAIIIAALIGLVGAVLLTSNNNSNPASSAQTPTMLLPTATSLAGTTIPQLPSQFNVAVYRHGDIIALCSGQPNTLNSLRIEIGLNYEYSLSDLINSQLGTISGSVCQCFSPRETRYTAPPVCNDQNTLLQDSAQSCGMRRSAFS